jgi:hypothetical protein
VHDFKFSISAKEYVQYVLCSPLPPQNKNILSEAMRERPTYDDIVWYFELKTQVPSFTWDLAQLGLHMGQPH